MAKYVCPKCGSDVVRHVTGISLDLECHTCGYRGNTIFFELQESKDPDLQQINRITQRKEPEENLLKFFPGDKKFPKSPLSNLPSKTGDDLLGPLVLSPQRITGPAVPPVEILKAPIGRLAPDVKSVGLPLIPLTWQGRALEALDRIYLQGGKVFSFTMDAFLKHCTRTTDLSLQGNPWEAGVGILILDGYLDISRQEDEVILIPTQRLQDRYVPLDLSS